MSHRLPLSTSLPTLDDAIGGFQPGSFNIIAGVVNSYKTTLLRRVVSNAVKSGKRALLFSETLPEYEWDGIRRVDPTFRILRDGDRLRVKTFDTREFLSLLERKCDYDVVAVDNLQFPLSPESATQPMGGIFQAYSDGATQIEMFAQRNQIPVIATMQLRMRIAETTIVHTLPSMSLYEIADTILFTRVKELGVTVGKARNHVETEENRVFKP